MIVELHTLDRTQNRLVFVYFCPSLCVCLIFLVSLCSQQAAILEDLVTDVPLEFDFLFSRSHAEVISGKQEGEVTCLLAMVPFVAGTGLRMYLLKATILEPVISNRCLPVFCVSPSWLL